MIETAIDDGDYDDYDDDDDDARNFADNETSERLRHAGENMMLPATRVAHRRAVATQHLAALALASAACAAAWAVLAGQAAAMRKKRLASSHWRFQ